MPRRQARVHDGGLVSAQWWGGWLRCAVTAVVAALIVVTAVPATAVEYTVDAGSSTFAIATEVRGMLKRVGHAPTFAITGVTGAIVLNAEASATARLTLPLAGLTVTGPADLSAADRDEIRQRALRDVFDSRRHPTATLSVTSGELVLGADSAWRGIVTANLTLAGRTQSLLVPVDVTATADELTACGQVAMRHSDFGLRPYSGLGGMLKVEDRVTLSFALRAVPVAL